MLGGGIRVPKIQELMSEKLGDKELGVHLNGDEAMCFGAAFIAQNYSRQFKVKKIFLTQYPSRKFIAKIEPIF
jgi:molecular chaperone DnaK (HSP70)